MKKFVLPILFLIFFLRHLESNAQADYEIITREFFHRYDSDPLNAMDFAFATNKWLNRNRIAIEKLKNNFKELRPQLGEYYGFEKLREAQITDRYRIVSYMVRYDRQPLRFTFVMYKPNHAWHVHNLRYDDTLDQDLEILIRE